MWSVKIVAFVEVVDVINGGKHKDWKSCFFAITTSVISLATSFFVTLLMLFFFLLTVV